MTDALAGRAVDLADGQAARRRRPASRPAGRSNEDPRIGIASQLTLLTLAPISLASTPVAADRSRVQVGLPHAARTAEVTIDTDRDRITVDDGTTITALRQADRDIRRHKVSNYR
jgi:hypothetical protein